MSLKCIAIYNDGTTLPIWQLNEQTGHEYSSEHIDRKRLESIIIFGKNNQPIIVQWFKIGQQLILRRRTENRTGINPHTNQPWGKTVVILVGWRHIVNDQYTQHISVVFEDDEHIENICDFREDHRWFYDFKKVSADAETIGTTE